MSELSREVASFVSAAEWVSELLGSAPPAAWDGPGLGEWTLRSLAGHTSRALLTVEQYLATPADSEEMTCAEEYYERIDAIPSADPAEVQQRGVDAGVALGSTPGAAFDEISKRVTTGLPGIEDRLIDTLAGGILLSNYLPTRTFELVVHGLDIARATGLRSAPPHACLTRALHLGVSLALRSGQGSHLLLALTGRERISGFSVLPS